MNAGSVAPTLGIDDEIELLELAPVSMTHGLGGPKKQAASMQ